MTRITRGALSVVAALVLALVAAGGTASAQTGSGLGGGGADCGQLTTGEFKSIGESWMGRMFGDAQTHDAMNRMMASMIGSSGAARMHEDMGRRVSGCGGGKAPAGFGRMMGAAGGMMGMMGDQGMMGGGEGASGPRMMGGEGDYDDDDDHMSGWGVGGMILFTLVLIGAVVLVLGGLRRAPGGTAPADVLRRRFAAGEITQSDFERRLKLLGGGR